eukprot:2121500-Pyramimonas_sp.AAC.1
MAELLGISHLADLRHRWASACCQRGVVSTGGQHLGTARRHLFEGAWAYVDHRPRARPANGQVAAAFRLLPPADPEVHGLLK